MSYAPLDPAPSSPLPAAPVCVAHSKVARDMVEHGDEDAGTHADAVLRFLRGHAAAEAADGKVIEVSSDTACFDALRTLNNHAVTSALVYDAVVPESVRCFHPELTAPCLRRPRVALLSALRVLWCGRDRPLPWRWGRARARGLTP